MKRFLALAHLVFGIVLLAAMSAESATSAFIRAESIVTALRLAQVAASVGQIVPLTQARSNAPNAALEVVSVEPLGGTDAKVRLRCRRHDECLPFYVVMHFAKLEEREAATREWVPPSRRSSAISQHAHRPLLVHTGDRATLVIEGEHLRAVLPVICLASGGEGERIRVSSIGHKRIYLVNVAAAGLVKGRL